jgi:hypothetical protein
MAARETISTPVNLAWHQESQHQFCVLLFTIIYSKKIPSS